MYYITRTPARMWIPFMPASYTHYRFGTQMLRRMPADIHRTAKRNRRLFDVGLQGPDLFFFYRPVVTTKIGKLGRKFHYQTGREFFSRVCRSLRLAPSEAGQAYLYGVLCHYALDACCHPLIESLSREASVSHTRIETEFDRFLLEQDGKALPGGMRLAEHLALTGAEAAQVCLFYPGTEPRHIRESLRGMVNIQKALELPEGVMRTALIKTMSAASETFRDMVMAPEPDARCRKLNGPLLERYQEAARLFPDMLLQLGAHLTYNAPLGAEFDPIFG